MYKIVYRFCHLKEQILKNKTEFGNVTDKIISYVGKDLYKQNTHPLGIIKNQICKFFENESKITQFNRPFQIFDNFSPLVTPKQNFDDILVPPDHVSRKRSDTYYISQDLLLRTHTSAHQRELIENKADQFVVFGDVYRRDEIDSTHYPIFHQMEAVKIFKNEQFNSTDQQLRSYQVTEDLKLTLENLVKFLFGNNLQTRWVEAYFPFTDPSLELEIYFKDKWIEMLGCGVIHRDLMKNWNREQEIGWAAGLGLERFAMLLFDIPDIRLFWSQDRRFVDQFKDGKIKKFQPFSKYPSCYKDVSFWVSLEYEENDLHELIRTRGGDLIENVECVDTFLNKKTKQTSKCYRIHYRSLERTLKNEEIDEIQFKIRDDIQLKLGAKLR